MAQISLVLLFARWTPPVPFFPRQVSSSPLRYLRRKILYTILLILRGNLTHHLHVLDTAKYDSGRGKRGYIAHVRYKLLQLVLCYLKKHDKKGFKTGLALQ